jgi:hypothetical protein
MKISGIGYDGVDRPVPTSMKFSTSGDNELKRNESERAASYRLGEQRHAQHVQAATSARPSHRAIQLTDLFVRRVHALQAGDPGLEFREALAKVIAAYPEDWREYQRAQQE